MKTIDIKSYSNQLHEKLRTELELIKVENSDLIPMANKSMTLIRSSICQLKEFVHQYKFCGGQEEIMFFKEIKPMFTSRYCYYESVFEIKVCEPIGSIKTWKEYYQQRLEQLQKFVNDNREFYNYYLSDSTQWDDKYFTRSNQSLNPELDSQFTTGFDLTLAKFLANKSVKEYLQDLLNGLDSQSADGVNNLNWTGTKASLIELIYGLQCVEVINNGKVDIKQIATSFETIFGISLGNYYRVFQDIRLRKNGQANFLDQLREKFIQRINEFD